VQKDDFDDLHRNLLEAYARLELIWPVRCSGTIVTHLSFAHYVRMSSIAPLLIEFDLCVSLRHWQLVNRCFQVDRIKRGGPSSLSHMFYFES
jgi:hypothetical protein